MNIEPHDVMLLHGDLGWCQRTTLHLADNHMAARWGHTRPCVERLLRSTSFDAALLDIDTLGARAALDVVLHLAHVSPAPAVIAWGRKVRPELAFELGRFGVRRLLSARPRPSQTPALVRDALVPVSSFEPHLRALVGQVGLVPLMGEVRRIVHAQALGLMRDNQAHAAELLGVTRQAVQQMVRRYSSEAPAMTVRALSRGRRTRRAG